jgi:hypothetical protein
MVCVSVRCRFPYAGLRVVSQRNSERTAFTRVERVHMTGHAIWYFPDGDSVRVDKRAIDALARRVYVLTYACRPHLRRLPRPGGVVSALSRSSGHVKIPTIPLRGGLACACNATLKHSVNSLSKGNDQSATGTQLGSSKSVLITPRLRANRTKQKGWTSDHGLVARRPQTMKQKPALPSQSQESHDRLAPSRS